MQLTLDQLFADPHWMLFAYEGDHARFIRMDRESFAHSIFVDTRVVAADGQVFRVPFEAFRARLMAQPPLPARLAFIHHMAQMGSTLLARAIDRPGRNLVIREPLHLRQLGVAHVSTTPETEVAWRQMLELSLAMLAKRFDPAEPNIVKGNVPISLIADRIDAADPGQPVILMHYSLDDYLAAVLRTDGHQGWVGKVAREVCLEREPLMDGVASLDMAEQAAGLWLAMALRFQGVLGANANARSLDANLLFESPADTIVSASAHVGTPIDPDTAAARAAGPLFATYGKDPTRAYDPQLRLERRAEVKQRLAGEIDRARAWIAPRARELGLKEALEGPLVGEPVVLLG